MVALLLTKLKNNYSALKAITRHEQYNRGGLLCN